MSLYAVDSEQEIAIIQDGKYIETGYLVTRFDFSDSLPLEMEEMRWPTELVYCAECLHFGHSGCDRGFYASPEGFCWLGDKK